MGAALIDLALITFIVTICVSVFGVFEFMLEGLEALGRRVRGLPVRTGDD
jgi:hypothetical protein